MIKNKRSLELCVGCTLSCVKSIFQVHIFLTFVALSLFAIRRIDSSVFWDAYPDRNNFQASLPARGKLLLRRAWIFWDFFEISKGFLAFFSKKCTGLFKSYLPLGCQNCVMDLSLNKRMKTMIYWRFNKLFSFGRHWFHIFHFNVFSIT